MPDHVIMRIAELWQLDSGKPFADVMEPWQRDFLLAAAAVRPDGRPKHPRILCSLPRQSSKTEMISLIGYYRTVVFGGATVSIATDLDQCRLQRNRFIRSMQRSPILAREFDLTAPKSNMMWLANRKGYWAFLPGDEASAGGHVVATLLADEIGQFPKGSWSFISQVSPSPAVPEGQVVFAGFKGGMQHRVPEAPLYDLCEQFRRGEIMGLNVEGRSPASWHTDAFLDENRRVLPSAIFRQLYCNEWAEGKDQFLSISLIETAVDATLDCGGVPGRDERVCLGLDLGLVSDRAVLTASALSQARGVRQIRSLVWQGSHEAPVDLQRVEDTVVAIYRDLHAGLLVLDPWQGRQMEQRMAKAGLNVHVHNFTGPSVERLAAGLYSLFANGRIKIPNDSNLKEELLGLTVKQTQSGYRWQHPEGRHDDRVTALTLSAWPLIETEVPAQTVIQTFDPLAMPAMQGVLA